MALASAIVSISLVQGYPVKSNPFPSGLVP